MHTRGSIEALKLKNLQRLRMIMGTIKFHSYHRFVYNDTKTAQKIIKIKIKKSFRFSYLKWLFTQS